MADSTSNLDLLADGQPLNRRTVNELADALSPSSYWGRRYSSTDDFTWGYYGGVIAGTRYPNGTLDLSAHPSTTVYIEHTPAGVVSANTVGFTAGRIPDYKVVTSADGVSSYEDKREGGGGGSFSISGLTVTVTDTRILFTYVGSDSVSRSGGTDLT